MSTGAHTKLQLAEAFEYVKKAEQATVSAESHQKGWFNSSDRDVAKVKADYKRAYTMYIEALERFNSVRAASAADADMVQFCSGHMKTNMDRCERVKERETNILLPASQAPFKKDGYVAGDILFERRPESRLKSKEEIYFDQMLGPGVYHVNVKFLDAPSVASSTVLVQVVVESRSGRSMKQLKHMPPFTQWSRCVGVGAEDAPARVRVKVTSNAWLRSLQVHVAIQSLVEAVGGNSAVPPPLPPYGMPMLPPMPGVGGGGGLGGPGGDSLASLPPPPTHQDPAVTVDELETFPVHPTEGPSWAEFSEQRSGAVGGAEGSAPPPPPNTLGEDPFTLGAVLRSVDDSNGPGARVPSHSNNTERYDEGPGAPR